MRSLKIIAILAIMSLLIGCGEEVTNVEIQGADLMFMDEWTEVAFYPDSAICAGRIGNYGDGPAYNVKVWFTWYADSAIYEISCWESYFGIGAMHSLNFYESLALPGIQSPPLDSVSMDVSWTNEE